MARIDVTRIASFVRLAFSCIAVFCVLCATPAVAQELPKTLSPLQVEPDANNVNIATGQTAMAMPTLSVPADPNLKFDRVQNVAAYFVGRVAVTTEPDVRDGNYSVHTGGAGSESFRCQPFAVLTCQSVMLTGSEFEPFSGKFRQAGSGAVYEFGMQLIDTGESQAVRTRIFYVTQIAYPNGQTLDFDYQTYSPDPSPYSFTYLRPSRVTSNMGYYIDIVYTSNVGGSPGWRIVQQASLYSNADTVNPLGRLTYGASGTITDLAGRVFTCSAGCGNGMDVPMQTAAAQMKMPTESAAALEYIPIGNTGTAVPDMVATAKRDGISYNYAYQNLTVNMLAFQYFYDGVTVTGPNGYNRNYSIQRMDPGASQGRSPVNVITSATDEIGASTAYAYDTSARLVSITRPEGNKENIAYDARGNVVSRVAKAKPGSGLADLTESIFVNTTTCTGVLCYRPIWHRDRLGHQTDYVYNANGQLTEQTDPADANGVRRKTYIAYETSTGVSRQSVVRVCGQGTTCGTTGEYRTEYSYWNSTLLPSQERRIDPATGQTIATDFTYDAAGRLIISDGSLAGTADAQYFRYDILGRKTWEISAADAAGVRIARRIAYRDADDKVLSVETGTIPDAASTALSVFERNDTAYDARRNAVREAASASGTTYTATDRSFDDRNRPICQTVRMNLALLPTAGSDACALSAPGSQGPDRITRNTYNAASQPLVIQKAYGTSLQQDYATYTYTPNGRQASVKDANGNLASMTYDGHDRQTRWNFPSKTTPGTVSTTDYEQYGYNANGNRTSLRKRDGSVLTYQYDALNRNTLKVVPERAGLPATHTRDVYYGYDLRGLQLYARFDSASGEGITNSYDSFGRPASMTQAMDGATKVIGYSHDSRGNRTQLTYPDNNKMSYSHDARNRMSVIYDGALGSTINMVNYGYDSRGRRASQTGRYGQATSFGYDTAGRLNSLSHNVTGTSHDVSYGFAYNSASQIVTRTTDNDSYAWTGAVNMNQNYAVNGLNQYTNVGGAAFAHDDNGNLTSDGASSYLYDIENRLVSASGATTASLRYDPLGRLYETSGGSTGTTRFLYDGDELVAEYNNTGGLLLRYVHGSSVDDPVIWYEGTDYQTPRFLNTDHQGSIVTLTQGGGGVPFAINRYDEWGIPAATNIGRFQYTGQAWIPELKMYYYKARMYIPGLGRFAQTDPIGYDDQVNLYAYVGNDPVNSVDPTGMACGTLIEGKIGSNCSGETILGLMASENSAFAGRGQKAKPNTVGSGTPRTKSSSQLRKDWEKLHGKPWPKDSTTGGNQCAHHCKALADGGKDSAENIRPMTKQDHMDHHKKNGDFQRWGARGGSAPRAMGVLGFATAITGVLSGRIRTDNFDNFISDVMGVLSHEDMIKMGLITPDGRPIA